MSHTGIPDSQLAVLTSKSGSKLVTLPVSSPGPGEVLIKNVAVASNPKDWKMPNFLSDYEAVEGNDVAGYIIQVGEGVKEYRGGERVAAFSKVVTKDNKVSDSFRSHLRNYPQRSSNSTAPTKNIPLRRYQRPFLYLRASVLMTRRPCR